MYKSMNNVLTQRVCTFMVVILFKGTQIFKKS